MVRPAAASAVRERGRGPTLRAASRLRKDRQDAAWRDGRRERVEAFAPRALRSARLLSPESPKATLAVTSMWGNSAGCWVTNPMPRSAGGTHTPLAVSTSVLPCNTTRPRSGLIKPPSTRSMEVLPAPEGPKSTVHGADSAHEMRSERSPRVCSMSAFKIDR